MRKTGLGGNDLIDFQIRENARVSEESRHDMTVDGGHLQLTIFLFVAVLTMINRKPKKNKIQLRFSYMYQLRDR